MIEATTGLPWINEANNGLVKDVIPSIQNGYNELVNHPEKYKQYEAPNGWGTVNGLFLFFDEILNYWERFIDEYPELVDVVTFWIV